MGDKSAIEWTDATWNPLVGCTRVSEGCRNCYAEALAHRLAAMGQARHQGLTKKVGGETRWTGEVRFVEDALSLPLRWKKPRRIFVNSMSDLFHERVPDEWIDRVFAVIALTPQHTHQVLTKRPERMRQYMQGRDWSDTVNQITDQYVRRLYEALHLRGEIVPPLPNVWLGVSVEDQTAADARIPLLLATPAAVRFLSVEPLLGPVELRSLDGGGGYRYNALCRGAPFGHYEYPTRVDWVIVGGESGPGARPCDLAWIRSVVAQCRAASVPVFVKQLGRQAFDSTAKPADHTARALHEGDPDGHCLHTRLNLRDRKGGSPAEWPEDLRVQKMPR